MGISLNQFIEKAVENEQDIENAKRLAGEPEEKEDENS
jgi:hypothetical protein